MNIAPYLLVVGAGLSIVLQQVLNSNLRAEIGSPWWAGFISYAGGTLAMLAMALALGEPWLTRTTAAGVSWYSWTGGLFGAIFIGVAILMVPRLGDRLNRRRPNAWIPSVRSFWFA